MSAERSAETGVSGWNRFVETASADVILLQEKLRILDASSPLLEFTFLAQMAFRVGLSSLLLGAEEVGRLALAIEQTLDHLHQGRRSFADVCVPLLEASGGLHAALIQLRNADKSGARVEGLPLRELTENLLERSRTTTFVSPTTSTEPNVAFPIQVQQNTPQSVLSPEFSTAVSFVWQPTVDEDMVELFFDEATERMEAISGKLIHLERAADDREVIADLFRDLHTVKGSSAMVGLGPMNRLAHASEDLVGLLREGKRKADAPVINALLSTLDGLRAMLSQARGKQPITVDPAPILLMLRDPSASRESAPTQELSPNVLGLAPTAFVSSQNGPAAPAPVGSSGAHTPPSVQAQVPAAARQTIRVDFDKLDRLLNLVGEFVLGRDGLRSVYQALSSVTGELSSDRALARRVSTVKSARAGRIGLAHQKNQPSSDDRLAILGFREELNRIERVLGSIAGDLDTSTTNLDAVSSELRDLVMRLRMIPIGGVFRKHQRTVRDLGQTLGKSVHLELLGEDTELDKLLVEALDEPLLHLVRNAVDHGMETPTEREQAGKNPEGTIRLSASHRGNQVEIRIEDDGRGMNPSRLKQKAAEKGIVSEAELESMDDRAALELIFRAGFSTAAIVSDVSGRGVGLDAVRQAIVTRLKGTIAIHSTLGEGSTFVLRLPLTLAIIQVLLAQCCGETLAIPTGSVERTIVVQAEDILLIGDREVIVVAGQNIPLVRLATVLELDGQESDESKHVILTEQGGDLYGIACDHLLGKKEIVIKSLGDLLQSVPCAAGATLLGDKCAIILDIPAVVARALKRPATKRISPKMSTKKARGNILLVDDSDTVREGLRRILLEAGYDVTTAEDGRIGLELCKTRKFDLVSTDVMMPHMDGYELTRTLRAMPEFRDVPIVMVTSRGERIDRIRGFDAGVDDYITKPHDRQLLLRSIQKLLGHDKEET